ncbi:MAG: AAA family ATPase, partial [Candidatus Calescibacterium sp.]|nr:AAA family ATPase [Candidatus Calescibacterium sp.]
MNGDLIRGLSELIIEIGRELNFDVGRFIGVAYNNEGNATSPIWSIERIEPFNLNEQPRTEIINAQDREVVLLTRWLQNNIKDISKRTIFVINYIDKLTPYSPRGIYPKDKEILITLIQKIIENITPNNRLIMVALQDTMIPIDYYTNSPKVSIMEIPMPDKTERRAYFSNHLHQMQAEYLEFISNISSGLYVRDLDNILRDIIRESGVPPNYTYSMLRKIINRYRIGTEEDPWANLPLTNPPKGLIDSAENWFKERVIAQDFAVNEVIKAIKKARAGVVGLASGQSSKPKAVFFFAGPTGTGKTFLAKKLAEYLFDSEDAFIRFDMSEFKEEHTVSKLIGSPPGYVGYEEGGQLTKAVKNRPFSVILFDEVEKAHPKIMDIFLQILDDGRLTDSRGQIVFFTECVIIFTSNIGTRTHDNRGNPISERDELEK